MKIHTISLSESDIAISVSDSWWTIKVTATSWDSDPSFEYSIHIGHWWGAMKL